MNPRIVKIVSASLGVPGFALLVFYLLMKPFGFTFQQISAVWAAIIALVFISVTGIITFFALRWWAPQRAARPEGDASDPPKPQEITVGTSVQISKVVPGQLELPGGVVKWSAPMNSYCGRKGVVISVSDDDGPPSVKLDLDSGKNWWSVEWLTPIP